MALLKEEVSLTRNELHGPGAWTQTSVTVTNGQAAAFVRGEVIQQDATTYEFETFVAAAPTGASAIVLEPVDVTGASKVPAIVMLTGTYRPDDLVWPTGITAAQKNAAVSAMRDRGLIPVGNFPVYA